MNRLRIILLTILLAVAYGAAGQGYVIDSVCRGAERHYRIDGEAGSSYLWTLTDATGAMVTLPETADTVSITWNMAAGDYVLSTLQTSIHGCDSLELGTIKVFDLPLAYAGDNIHRCSINPYTFASATASGYSSLLWVSNGDGKFNDSTILNPEYSFGPADIALGSVTFTLKATGFGKEGSCPPTESSMTISFKNEIIPLFAPIGPLCLNSSAPALPLVSMNGITGNWTPAGINTSVVGSTLYTFTPDAGQCGQVITFEIKVASPEITNIQVFTSSNGLANGYAKISADGTASSLAYSLNGTDWQTSEIFTKLAARTYTVMVRNDNGCIISQQFTVPNTLTGAVKVLAGNIESCISVPIDIPVRSYDFTRISAFTVQLAFDPSIMTFNGISQMNHLLSNGILSTTLVSPGVLQVSFSSADSLNFQSEDQLFSLNFIGVSSGQTELKWNLVECVIYSASGYEIPAIYTKGSVDIRPVPQIYFEGNGGYCEKTPHKLKVGSLTGQNLSYEWTSPWGTTQTGPEWDLGSLDMSASGTYQVKASDGTACATTETLDLQVYPNPHIKLQDYDTLCSEHEVMLNAGPGFAAYKWQDGSTEPQLLATSEGIYWVTVTDNNGCQASDSVLLRQCELMLWMPNVFTPDGDGINDVFLPVYNPDIEITFQMQIFNKWGEQIFSTNDIAKGWDGTYKGQLCTEDVYSWVISFSAPKTYKFLQKSPQSGNVMLLK